MKIAFVVSDSIDEAWGHRSHILEVHRELGRQADVRLYLPKPRTYVLDLPGVVTVPEVRIPIAGIVLRQAALLFRLVRDVRRDRPDAIYARHSPFSIAPLLASRFLRVPLVIELNCLTGEDLRAEGVATPVVRLAEANEDLNCRNAAMIVVVSEGIASAVASRYDRPDAVVIANGVDCEQFRPGDQDVAISRLGLDPRCRYVCFVGNLAPWQGLEYLVDAMVNVIRSCPSARALIVGHGKEEGELKRRAHDLGLNETCLFIGSVPHDQIPVYISAATVCVAPFGRLRNESIGLSPLKLYEYMACGRAVVCSAIPGVTEILRESECGVAIPPEDADALASALVEALSDIPATVVLGRNGRRYVENGHCWAHVAKRILTVVESAVAGQTAGGGRSDPCSVR